MKMLKRAASINAIHDKIYVLIDPVALTITTIYRAIVSAHNMRVNNATHTVSNLFYFIFFVFFFVFGPKYII